MHIMRLDQELVIRKIYPTRAKAVAAIKGGLVTVNGVPAQKASQLVGASDVLVGRGLPYISGRGSLKLTAALDAFGINVQGRNCLDVGASTGGFTEVLLSRGAQRVIAVDVGTGQLIPEIRDNPRVISLEQTDIRALPPYSDTDLIVIDVSFISLTNIVDAIVAWGAPEIVALIKPQFEVPRDVAARAHGIIKSHEYHQMAIDNVTNAFFARGYTLVGVIESPVRGGSGNTEFLGCFKRV